MRDFGPGRPAGASLAGESAPEAVDLARALVSVLTQAGHARTPEAAVEVLLTAVGKLRDDVAVKDAGRSPVPGDLRHRHSA